MYKYFLLLAFLIPLTVFAQVKEPAFIGEVVLVDNTNTTLLEKKRASIETKAGAGLYIVGMGKIRSKVTISEPYSSLRLDPGKDLTLVVRTRDNDIDPISVISFFRFESSWSQKHRRAELSSVGTFSGASSNKLDYIDFKAEKFGDHSYLLHVPQLEIGEYGIICMDPHTTGEKITIVSCFGVGSIEDVKKIQSYNDDDDDEEE